MDIVSETLEEVEATAVLVGEGGAEAAQAATVPTPATVASQVAASTGLDPSALVVVVTEPVFPPAPPPTMPPTSPPPLPSPSTPPPPPSPPTPTPPAPTPPQPPALTPSPTPLAVSDGPLPPPPSSVAEDSDAVSSNDDGAAGGAVGAMAAVLVLLGVGVFVYRRRQQMKGSQPTPKLTNTVTGADISAPANRKMSEVRVSWTPRARPTPPPEAHPDLIREHTAGGPRKDFV